MSYSEGIRFTSGIGNKNSNDVTMHIDTALERNANRPGKVIPPALLSEMHNNYELPTDADRINFSNIIKVGN
jgi:hypothetical protein